MKALLALAATFGLGISQGWAAQEYQGSLCVHTLTTACTAVGWGKNCFTYRFAPPNLSDNGPATRLSVFTQTYAANYTLASGTLVGSTYKAVSATVVARGGFQFTGASSRLTTQSPATLTPTSQYVIHYGSIARWDNIVGCTVTFRATGALRP